MADRKISDLTALTTPAVGDFLPIVDISEVAAASKNKRITIEELMRGMPDGTAAAPGIAFETDPNTGIYSPGADQLAVATNGTGRLFINSTGLVGIGTSAPNSLLEIRGTNEDGKLTLSNSNTGVVSGNILGSILFRNYDISLNTNAFAGNVASVAAIAESDYVGASGSRAGIAFSTNDITRPSASGPLALIERMRLDSQGRLGIGTTSPNELLEVAGNIHLSGADRSIFNRSNNALTFGTNNAERARIDSSGRLLVGTSSTSIASTAILQGRSDNATEGAVLRLARGLNNPADGSSLSALSFTDSGHTNAALIAAVRDGGTWTSGVSQPTRLVFSTTADGSASPTERLRITSAGVLQVADAGNITVGTTTGTKIGTATTQKIGFFNKAPVVQPIAVADATDAATAITQLNALLARMRDLGLIAT